MTVVNIRGTSGSGKSTLVHRFLQQFRSTPVMGILDDWKKERIVGYTVEEGYFYRDPEKKMYRPPTFVLGRYETACGGCDSLSYKGSHTDMEAAIMEHAAKGENVIFEGLTVSSTVTRWMRVSEAYPGKMVWMFMNTPEEECYKRIIARSGREPKRDAKGLADYNRKHRSCLVQRQKLIDAGERVLDIGSDETGYQTLLEVLHGN